MVGVLVVVVILVLPSLLKIMCEFAALVSVEFAFVGELPIAAVEVLEVDSVDSFHSLFDLLISDRKLEALHVSAEG